MLAEEVDWRWVFFVNAPIGIVVLLGTLASITESRGGTEDRRLDLGGALLSGLSLFAVTFALLKGNDFGWSDPRTLVPLIGGLAGLGAFIAYERRIPAPMLDMSLFRSATFAGANIVAVFAGFALFGLLFFASLFIQSIMGFSATETGLSQLPMMAMIMAMSPVVSKLIGKVGTGPLLAIGMAILAVSFVFFAQLGFDSDFWDLVPGMIIGGIGFAWVLTPLTAAALSSVPIAQAGVGAAVINATRQVGGSLGLAILGVISAEEISKSLLEGQAGQEGFVDSFGYMMYTAAGMAVVGAVVAYAMIVRPAQATARAAASAAAEAAAEAAAPAAPHAVSVQHSNNWAVAGPSVVSALPGSLAERAAGARPRAWRSSAARLRARRSRSGASRSCWGAESGTGRLGDDPELSRRHARLSRSDGRVVVEDLGSTNGTLVNGKAISDPTTLAAGDSIEVGSTELRVLDVPAAAPAVSLSIDVVDGPASGTRIPLGTSPLVFGRAETGQGVLGNDPELSRRHASASPLDGTRLLVEDLGSTNGTFVNEHRIAAPTVVGQGDCAGGLAVGGGGGEAA